MTSICLLCVQDKKKNPEYYRRDSLITPLSYLLRAASESCMVLVMPTELRAGNIAEKNMQTTVRHSRGSRRQERREAVKRDWVFFERGLTGALRQSLNKAGEKERNAGRQSKRAQQPGQGSQDSSPASSWLFAGERSSRHSHFQPSLLHSPLLWEMTTNLAFSSEKAPNPIFVFFYFPDHMGPGALCYLVIGLRMNRNTSLKAPHWLKPLEWILNIWSEERQASIIL